MVVCVGILQKQFVVVAPIVLVRERFYLFSVRSLPFGSVKEGAEAVLQRGENTYLSHEKAKAEQ